MLANVYMPYGLICVNIDGYRCVLILICMYIAVYACVCIVQDMHRYIHIYSYQYMCVNMYPIYTRTYIIYIYIYI